jgi:outer membrane biosynthesis protein TonB
VANQSAPPPPPPGGNLKLVAVGLVFLVAAIGLWIAVGQEEPPPPAAVAPPQETARVNPMAEQDLELEAPQPEPDAAVAVVAPVEPKKRTGGAGKGDDWDCVGDLKGAAAVINEQRPQVRACYERRLKVNNILQGDLRVKLKVGANGKVMTTNLSGSLQDDEVHSCVRKLAASWSFETPSGGSCAVIQVPFQFSPKP